MVKYILLLDPREHFSITAFVVSSARIVTALPFGPLNPIRNAIYIGETFILAASWVAQIPTAFVSVIEAPKRLAIAVIAAIVILLIVNGLFFLFLGQSEANDEGENAKDSASLTKHFYSN